MKLTEKEQEVVRSEVLKHFDLDEIEAIDKCVYDFAKMSVDCTSIFEFLQKVKTKYPDKDDHNALIAAFLWGVQLYDMGYKKMPDFGHAS